ncbi:MAG: alpha/beta hydrolase [Sedimentisphaerales bacterium]|nr:alpha/beta hydrolase [Sedimentisphaerales bacterium]
MKTYSRSWLITVSLFLLLSAGCSVERKNQVVSSNGVVISYDVQGEGEPALVFVHGWCCDRRYWNYQVPYFSREYKVVTIDLAGHGLSGFGRESWTIEAFGGNVVSVVEKLGIEKVILIGHSMGGAVIVEAAKRMPDRVVGLVGVDTLHNVETEYPKEQLDDFIYGFKEDFVKNTREFVRNMFPPDSDPNIVERIVEDMSSAHPLVGVTALLGYFNYDVAEALEEVKVPLYCINTDLLPTNVEANRRHAVTFEVKLMPGMGHFIMIEDPETFNRLLDEVIDELKIKELESGEEN